MAVGEPHARFELIERCLEELESLKLLGVTSDMHVGEPQDSFEDPVKLAEYVAGQLLRLGPKEIPTGKQIKHVIDEYVEEKQKMDVKEKMNLAFIPPEEWPEVLKNFNNNHSQVNVTSRMLASDLDIQDERFSIPKPREESV